LNQKPAEKPPQSTHNVRYSRVLALPGALALGTCLGVAITVYSLLGELVLAAGKISLPVVFIITAMLALPIILTLAERVGVAPGRGGLYHLAQHTDNPLIMYATGLVQFTGYASLISMLAWGISLFVDLILQQYLSMQIQSNWIAAGVLLLFAIYHLIRGGSGWRTLALITTLGVLSILALSVRSFFGLQNVQPLVEFSPSTMTSMNLAALLASSFWGLNTILSSRNEIRRPTQTIFPAMLLATGISLGVGLLAGFALQHYPGQLPTMLTPFFNLQAGLGLLTQPAVNVLYVLPALALLTAAMNRTIVNCLAFIEAMGRDGFVYGGLQRQLTRRGSPILPILIVMFFSVITVILVPILQIVALVSVCFLWASALVHLPDLILKNPKLPENRTPNLPFHPLFPGLTVAVGLLLPVYLPVDTWKYVLVWAAVGILYYVIYARRANIEVRRKALVFGDSTAQRDAITGYQVMVVLLNGESESSLLRLADKLACARQGTLHVLKVLSLPEEMATRRKNQLAVEAWTQVAKLAEDVGVVGEHVKPLVRLAPSSKVGILDAVQEEKVDLLLLAWTGPVNTDQRTPDPLLDGVFAAAVCDVAVLRGKIPDELQQIFIPSAGGPHARMAIGLGKALGEPQHAQLTVLHYLIGKTTPEIRAKAEQDLAEQEKLFSDYPNHELRIDHTGVLQTGILNEVREADLTIIGASKEGLFNRSYFGGMPVQVAYANSRPTLLVRSKESVTMPLFGRAYAAIFSLLPMLSIERRVEVVGEMETAANPSSDFFVLIVLSAVIASLGLLQNSAAVIIGAMLVAPLMSPILAVAMSMVVGNIQTLWQAAEATVKGVVIAVLVSIIVVMISPLKPLTNEIMARTQPNVLDLLVALASGAAAGYAISRRELAAALPGVAIAAALVPPLGVIGYGIGTSQFSIALGALLLFTTNLIAIVLAAAVVFLLLGFQPDRKDRTELVRGLQIAIFSVLLVAIVLGFTTIVSVRNLNQQVDIENSFRQEIIGRAAQVESFQIQRQNKQYVIDATILNYRNSSLTPEDIQKLEQNLSKIVGEPVQINATVLDAYRLNLDLRSFEDQQLLNQSFNEAISKLHAEASNVTVTNNGDGYQIEATIIVFQDAAGMETQLQTIQRDLTDQVGAPITINAVIISGTQSTLQPVATPTPGPTITPTPAR
jgi:uncharacterized hydrophobic protein (TIGR00271 family)